MSQDIINNHFLEESVFAIADGYCVINLTKNIVRGSLYKKPRGQEKWFFYCPPGFFKKEVKILRKFNL